MNWKTPRFVIALLSEHIIPIYNACKKGQEIVFLRNSIGQLFNLARYKSSGINSTSYQEFLFSFLRSSMENLKFDAVDNYPILLKCHNYAEWVRKWFCRMTKPAHGKAFTIFEACLGVVLSNERFAANVIPYLVFHVVDHCSEHEVNLIKNEILSIFDADVEYGADSERSKFIQQASRLAIAIFDYLRRWLYFADSTDRTTKSSVERVSLFLQDAPVKKMAIALLNAGDYPKALLHFET